MDGTQKLIDSQDADHNNHHHHPAAKKTHMFRKKTFNKPTYCQHCTDLLWGLTNQGVQCVDCKYTSHGRCRDKVVTECQQRGDNDGYVVSSSSTIAAADEDRNRESESSESRSETTGHYFKRKTFHKPTYCNYCSDLLWGLTNQGMQCNDCGYATHERCQFQIITACNSKAWQLVQHPKFHSLVNKEDEKKKFCNVCRKLLGDNSDLTCQDCHYYVHEACKPRIVHNCKLSSSFTNSIRKVRVKQRHHWSEGHLPNNSKCAACSKPCSSTDCLYGLRCSWCSLTSHTYCVSQLGESCNFGTMRNLILPPFVVKDTNPDCLLRRRQTPRGEVTSPDAQEARNNNKLEQFMLRVHEGPVETPTLWREVAINKKTTVRDVIENLCKKFKVKEHQKTDFLNLTFVHKNGVERKLDERDVLWSKIDTDTPGMKQIFLRHANLDDKELKLTIYAGAINTTLQSISMKVNIMSEAKDIIADAAKEFKLAESDESQYCITQMKVSPNAVTESPIDDGDSLFEALVSKSSSQSSSASGQDSSAEELHFTRFYLKERDTDAFDVALFVGSLPPDLTVYQYKYLLSDLIGKWEDVNMIIENKFASHGALVIRFKSLASFKRSFSCLMTAQIEGKSIFLKVLPELKEEMLSNSANPLIVFVNSKSGGGQGSKLIRRFKRILNPFQVSDLSEGGPLPALYMFRHVKRFRILIAGGDGTFGWVLNVLDDIRHQILQCSEPPSALLPLGTGNDLARVLNWGAGYTGEACSSILSNVMNATETRLDRWNLVFDSSSYIDPSLKEDAKAAAAADSIHMVPMNNYFSVGIDASICLEFHLSREENPEKFTNRFHNKGVYVKASLKNMSKSNMANLQEQLQLTVDGVDVPLPNLEGLCVLNISSWAAGGDAWGKDNDEKFYRPSFGDGLLEVVGFTGVYHMGKIQGGVSSGIRIAQGAQINLLMKEDLPVQVDGEPWMQPTSLLIIRPNPLSQARMLMKANQVKSITSQ